MLVYRTGRRGKLPSDFDLLDPTLERFRNLLRGKGPYKLKPKGGRFGGEIGLPAVMKRTSVLLEEMGEGDGVWVKVKGSTIPFVLDVGKLHLEPPPRPPANISSAIANVHNFIFTEVQRQAVILDEEPLHIVTMGYTVCKFISGTRIGSQHSPGPPFPMGGNAVDFVVRHKGGSNCIEATDAICNKLAGKRYVAQVLWRGVANHFPWHAHISGAPRRSGLPECLR